VKPWVVRVFDPRPPWWRSNVLLSLFVAALVLSAITIFANYHGHGRYGGPVDVPFFITTTGEVVSFQELGEQHVTHLIRTPVRIHYYENDHYRKLLIEFLPVTYHENAWPDKMVDIPMSHLDFTHKYPQWAVGIEGCLKSTLRDAVWDYPPWVREAVFRAIPKRNSYESTAYKPRFYAWLFSWVTAPILVTILGGGLWARNKLNTRRLRMQAGICPSCKYQYDRRISQICPECGIRLDREAKLIDLLYTRGYRGLKRFNELDETGSWKS
jgi:hypothetical protein